MKKYSIYLFTAIFALGIFAACGKDDPATETNDDGYGDVTNIVNDYVDKTVLPTYEDMKNKAWTLHEKVAALESGITSAKIEAACNAWRETRIPWEQSEAFLFGPANRQNLDPLLDSWPLDQTQIDQVLNSSGAIDGGSLGANVRGFHTIEYFLFLDGKSRISITERQLEYLLVVTELLRDDCIKLWSSWAGADALSGKDAEAMDNAEYEPDAPSYALQFKNAGQKGSTYISQSDAIDAIVEGCATIADEVGSQKIGSPNGSGSVLDVESWYSWNSITDYANNIESIRNSYLGGREGNRGNSLSAYVKGLNADLDTEIINVINEAHTAISEMQAPFRNHLTGAGVDRAMAACAALEKTISKIQSLKN